MTFVTLPNNSHSLPTTTTTTTIHFTSATFILQIHYRIYYTNTLAASTDSQILMRMSLYRCELRIYNVIYIVKR